MIRNTVHRLFSNILFRFTVVAFIITGSISLILIVQLFSVVNEYNHEFRISFYQNYTEKIVDLYPEVFLPVENQTTEMPEGTAKRIREDISLFGTINRLRFFNPLGIMIWNSKTQEQTPDPPKIGGSLLKELRKGKIKQLDSSGSSLQSGSLFYIPVMADSRLVGIAEFSDTDPRRLKADTAGRQLIITTVGFGGIILYLLLFSIFYNAYRNQKKAISQLEQSQEVTIISMSLLAELRDDDTGSHIRRTSAYCRLLGEALREKEEFQQYITPRYLEDLIRSAPLHDIGKVGIPDKILLKRGSLSPEENEIIRTHPRLGAGVLQKAAEQLDFQSFFSIGEQMVLSHHENWDGSGYPNGLKGVSIPLSARIMALADVYDALRTLRPYKDPMEHEMAVKIIREESGRKFDPSVVEAFLSKEQQFRDISESSQEGEDPFPEEDDQF